MHDAGFGVMVSVDEFRDLLASLPEVIEKPHWDRASFRIRNKILATLDEAQGLAVLKLSLADMEALTTAQPEVFRAGPWKHQGWTEVQLNAVDASLIRNLLWDTWRRMAPKTLVKEFDPKVDESP